MAGPSRAGDTGTHVMTFEGCSQGHFQYAVVVFSDTILPIRKTV